MMPSLNTFSQPVCGFLSLWLLSGSSPHVSLIVQSSVWMVSFPVEPVIRYYRQLIELSPLERTAGGLAREIPLASRLGIEQRQFRSLRSCKEFQFSTVDASIKG